MLTVNTAPLVTVDASDMTICEGDNASFSITATGTGLTYQWEVSTNGGASYASATGGIYSNETTATLNLTGATAAENGNMYQCIVTGTCIPAVTSTAKMLTVNTAPAITLDATDMTICTGNDASFAITATGTGLAYQWEVSTNGGASYANATGGIYSNETTNTLNLTAATVSENMYMYRCVVSGTCSPNDTSLVYTFYVNNTSSSSLTQSACTSYTLNAQTYTTSGTYTQQFTNAAGCDSTLTLNLTIDNIDNTVTANGNVISANQMGATYQWVDCGNNNAVIPNEINQVFTATSNGDYAVIVTMNTCTDTSVCTNVTTTGISDNSFANMVALYPNPADKQITISAKRNLTDFSVKLMTLTGQVIMKKENLNGSSFTLNIAEQASGFYFLEISEGTDVVRMKFMKD